MAQATSPHASVAPHATSRDISLLWYILLRYMNHIYPIDSGLHVILSIPFLQSTEQSLVHLNFLSSYTLSSSPGSQNLTLYPSSGLLHAWDSNFTLFQIWGSNCSILFFSKTDWKSVCEQREEFKTERLCKEEGIVWIPVKSVIVTPK